MPVADKIRISIDDTSWIRRMFEEGLRRKRRYDVNDEHEEGPGRFASKRRC